MTNFLITYANILIYVRFQQHNIILSALDVHDVKSHLLFVILLDLVKFVIYTLDSGVHMTFYVLTKGYTVSGNQGTHDKLNQIRNFLHNTFAY